MSKFLTRIFVVEDNEFFSQLIKQKLEMNDKNEVTLFHNGEDFQRNLYLNPDIVVLDYNLPNTTGIDLLKEIKNFNEEIKTILLSGQEKVDVVIEAFENGAEEYIKKDDNALQLLDLKVQKHSSSVNLRKEVDTLREQIIDRNRYDRIIGESNALLKVLRLIQKVEKTNMLALITGESGTGKELVASAIHYNSARKNRPFVAVNVAAIPEDLMESELFGHERGAFTGADSKRIGKFEEANEGTIFLDEIGEMDIHMQTKLLRVLQESKITRLGSNKEIPLNVRVIAATNKNLAQRVKDGKMREDLYYRLQGFLIHLPPLRERDNDILLLAKSMLKIFCDANRIPVKSFSSDALKAMMKHPWSGNVRELKAFIERAVLISDHDIIEEEDLIFSQDI
ncbi:MAG TPA: sigma-54 dependent transcriptional regulator [Flavobacteriales bacterium]|jgi:DNA-binding NtrC family response regulator|nr:sigma-54 dependent transcriptional regulator [Flavobacteriales bacterium]